MKKSIFTALLLILTLTCANALAIPMPAEGAAYNEETHQIVLSLIENASTGYEWTVEGTDGQALLSLAGEDYISLSDENPAAPGTPSAHIWLFDLNGAGEATLTLSYARAWEENSACRTITLTVSVSQDGSLSYSISGLTA